MLKFIGNIFWLIFGGIVIVLLWALAGLICCITIIGIPFGIQCFKFARLALWPFGASIVYGSFKLGATIGNILWILLFGWELAVVTAVIGLVYCITIVGIPFGLQIFKLAALALWPFGAKIS